MTGIRAVFLVAAAAAAVLAMPAHADAQTKAPAAAGKNAAGKGGYSYSYEDTINSYGGSRTRYNNSVYVEPRLDRQTDAGPFDHGYFFDSATGLHGGDSPYLR